MEISETRHVKAARVRQRCQWCWEWIDVGTSCKTWFTLGDAVTARMHPECYRAMLRADLHDDELPAPGDFRRGCWCGESEEQCTCKDGRALTGG